MVLKDNTGKILSRSEGEAVMKGRGAITISIYAALLAICTLVGAGVSGKILSNTLKANDTWSFYQAKAIKQSILQMSVDDYRHQLLNPGSLTKDQIKSINDQITDLETKIERYESDPSKGEGKKELYAKGKSLEAERDEAKQKSPYFSFAGAFLQIAIVLSSTAILAVSMEMLFASIGFGILGALMLSNGIWYYFVIPWI